MFPYFVLFQTKRKFADFGKDDAEKYTANAQGKHFINYTLSLLEFGFFIVSFNLYPPKVSPLNRKEYPWCLSEHLCFPLCLVQWP